MNDWYERFDRLWMPEPNTGCWLWIASDNGKGYGQFTLGGKARPAHRLSYERWNGPIPNVLHLDHLCRQTLCVNPEHLEAVTSKENSLRGFSPAANNARKTHCPQGHPLSGDNLYSYKGYRQCRACRKAYAAMHEKVRPKRDRSHRVRKRRQAA